MAKVRRKRPKKKEQKYIIVNENTPVKLSFTFRAWQIAKLGGVVPFREYIYNSANALLVAEDN